jgi:hypothetical protein
MGGGEGPIFQNPRPHLGGVLLGLVHKVGGRSLALWMGLRGVVGRGEARGKESEREAQSEKILIFWVGSSLFFF